MIDDATRTEIVTTNEVDGLTPRREEMDLETARAILQAIVNTHENSITDSSPLDQIGGYSTEQVREAMEVVADNLMSTHQTPPPVMYQRVLKKNTPKGELSVLLDQPDGPTMSPGRRILLELDSERDNRFIECQFPLAEPSDDKDRAYFGFKDFHGGSRRMVNLSQEFNIDDYRFAIRGLRWMSANMLDWDNSQLIMPEQLDNLPLSTSQSLPQLLPTHS